MQTGHLLQIQKLTAEHQETCDVHELALISGIQETALLHFSQLGLLHPQVSRNGRIRYTRDSLVQLLRIVMMQVLEFSVDEIRDALVAMNRQLNDELRLQRLLCTEIRRRLNHVIYCLEQAEQVNHRPNEADWHYIGRAVDMLHKLRDRDHLKEMYAKGEGVEDRTP